MLQCPQRTQCLLRRVRDFRALRALAQMLAQPLLLRRRNPFDALFRDQSFRACMQFV